MKYIRTENGVEKYDSTTHDTVKIENNIIIGTGTTLIAKSDAKWVYWEKFGKPSSLKDYGTKAINKSYLEYCSNYELTDGTNPLYYDEVENKITTVDTGTRAVINGALEEMIQANLQDSGFAVLKDVSEAVSCGTIDPQSVIDAGLEDQQELKNLEGGAICLIINHTEEQDLAVFTAIKDERLTGDNFNNLVIKVVGV